MERYGLEKTARGSIAATRLAGTGQAATIASLIGLDWYVVGSLNSSADTFRVHFDDAHYSYTRPTGFSEFTFIENFYYVTCDDEYYRLRD